MPRHRYSDPYTDQRGPLKNHGEMFRSRRRKPTMDHVGYKLSRRKMLLNRRRFIVHIEFFMSITGMLLMLAETECFANGIFAKDDMGSYILKGCISFSTLILVIANVFYHVTSAKIKMVTNSWDDCMLALRFPWSYIRIFVELTVCIIHPFPGNILIPIYGADGQYKMASLDAVLSVLMLSRLYIFGKFIVVNHRLLTNTSTQSVGALNRVQISTAFVFKALMSTSPGIMVVSIMLCIVIVGSWAMRTCEVYYDAHAASSSYSNTIWLVVITFLTVGYGDFAPGTYCGRFVSVCTGLMGVGTTALLVAVLTSKLEQTRPERYVHNYVMRAHYDSIRRKAASKIITSALLLWTYKRRGIVSGRKRSAAQRRMLNAIHMMRNANKWKMALKENTVGVVEIANIMNEVQDSIDGVAEQQKNTIDQQNSLRDRLEMIEGKLDQLL